MSKCYRNEFYEWIKDKKIFNDMSTLNKETAIEIATCWLNGNDCYRILARNQGKNFSKICAIEFVWFIKDQRIAKLEKELHKYFVDNESLAEQLRIVIENNLFNGNKIKQLKHDLAVYKIAFENVLSDADEKINTIYRTDCCCSAEMENSQYYLDQAEKELKEIK